MLQTKKTKTFKLVNSSESAKELASRTFRKVAPGKNYRDILADAIEARKKKKGRFGKIGKYLLAEFYSGRGRKVVKDLVVLFNAESPQEFFEELIKTNDSMEPVKQKISRKFKQRSTKAGITVLVAVLAIFGVEVEVVVLSELLQQVITAVAGLVAGASAIYEMIREEQDENTPKAAG